MSEVRRELGLGLQTDKALGEYGPGCRQHLDRLGHVVQGLEEGDQVVCRTAVQRARATREAVARLPGVRVIDAANRFCLARVCPAVIGNVIVYRNTGHITASYMRTLSPWLARRMR